MDKAKNAAENLGCLPPKFLNYPDNRLDMTPLLDLAKKIEIEVNLFRPERIITHFAGDLNLDHKRTIESVIVASRPQNSTLVREVISFEIPSSTEWNFLALPQTFQPNLFIDVTEFKGSKLEALKSYESELRPFPHTRSLEAINALMSWRGATVHMNYAEAFVINRIII